MEYSLSQDFYVYLFYRPRSNVPFYVGKGHGRRINDHDKCARNRETCKHLTCRVIRKVWREGEQITKVKICENVCEETAFRVERVMISIGRASAWPLVNKTDGGEGIRGFTHTHSLDERQRRSKNLKRFYEQPRATEMLKQRNEKMWASPEYREKRRQAQADPEVRRKMGMANVGNKRRAKTYAGFVSPEGIIYENIFSLRAFCLEHNLQTSGMNLVNQGRQVAHKGWTKYPPLEKPVVLYQCSGFISPDGTVYTEIPQLAAFCKEHGLAQNTMSEVANGKRKSHKGWTRYNPTPDAQPLTIFDLLGE